MKKTFIAVAFVLSSALLNHSTAQISISLNIGVQPSWGPTGYDHVDYYYIPDIHCYYYVPSHQFIYLTNGRWSFSAELPDRCRGFDLYHSYKVVMNEPQPYLHYDEHRAAYDHYRGDPHGQIFIRDDRDDDRYRDHWHDQQEADEEWRHDRGHDHGHGNGHAYGHRDRD
jgi:hypothetical protein